MPTNPCRPQARMQSGCFYFVLNRAMWRRLGDRGRVVSDKQQVNLTRLLWKHPQSCNWTWLHATCWVKSSPETPIGRWRIHHFFVFSQLWPFLQGHWCLSDTPKGGPRVTVFCPLIWPWIFPKRWDLPAYFFFFFNFLTLSPSVTLTWFRLCTMLGAPLTRRPLCSSTSSVIAVFFPHHLNTTFFFFFFRTVKPRFTNDPVHKQIGLTTRLQAKMQRCTCVYFHMISSY